MTTFQKIVYNIIQLNDNIFSYHNGNNTTVNCVGGIYKLFFYHLYSFHQNKQRFFYTTIHNFYFSSKSLERKEFERLFYKIQKTYFSLNRFVYLYKVKKSKIVVNTDMQLNVLSLGQPNVISIYHMGSIYLFRIEELMKLIYMSLTNAVLFFNEPIIIKNPYNNTPFTKSILYYINSYLSFSSKMNTIKHSHMTIFFYFLSTDFNLSKFVNNYEEILRECALKNYFTNTIKNTIEYDILNMIDLFNRYFRLEKNKIEIHPDFPREELIQTMKPYLYLKFRCDYSLFIQNRILAKKELSRKWKLFQKCNPFYGRKYIKIILIMDIHGKRKVFKKTSFHTKQVQLNEEDMSTFMNNHLEYQYELVI
jgi:hypothetical protein